MRFKYYDCSGWVYLKYKLFGKPLPWDFGVESFFTPVDEAQLRALHQRLREAI